MAEIVGVHGIAQQQGGRNQLRDKWFPALLDGLERSAGEVRQPPSFDIAFYGDVFLKRDSASRIKGSLREDFEDLDASELSFLDEAADEALRTGPSNAEDKGVPRVPAILQPVIRKLVRRFDGKSALLFVHALRQVRLYLADDDLASDVRDRASAEIRPDCRVLIGHSLGSVVAFEVLALNPLLRVDTLLTLGSPLGMRTVSTRLRGRSGADGPLQIARWVNVYDPGDAVACAGDLHPLWPAVRDYTVSNEKEPHAVERYLAKRETGDAVLSKA